MHTKHKRALSKNVFEYCFDQSLLHFLSLLSSSTKYVDFVLYQYTLVRLLHNCQLCRGNVDVASSSNDVCV